MNKYYKLIHYNSKEAGPLQLKNISGVAAGFSMVATGTPSSTPNLEYSLDGTTWTAYDFTNLPTITVPADGQIYLRGTNTSGFNVNDSNYYSISMDQDYDLIGNLISLVDYQNMNTLTNLPSYSFISLFRNDTHIIHSHLANFGVVNKINSRACNRTFEGCSNLLTPVNTTSITIANGMAYMYRNCTSLMYCPDLGNVTRLEAESDSLCYTFEGCSSIKQGADLHSWNYAQNGPLKGTFKNCTSMIKPPIFGTLSTTGYRTMYECFMGCTSLVEGPDFRLYTYQPHERTFENLFSGCSSLKKVYAPATIPTSGNNLYQNWLQNVPSGGTLYLPYDMVLPIGASGVPSNWIVEYY